MNESRLITVQDRIITLAGVRRLAALVWDEFAKNADPHKNVEISFSAKCEDQSSFASEDMSIFDDDSVIALKRVSSVNMVYWDFKAKARITVSLYHGGVYGNSISIEGTDSRWVNGTLRLFEEVVSSFTPQNTFVRKYGALLNGLFAFGIGSMYVWFVILLSSSKPQSPLPDWLVRFPFLTYLIKYTLALLVGYLPARFLVDKIRNLWPRVEFQIGPEFTFTERKRRLWLSGAFVLGALPLLLSLIYDIAKAVLGG
jgi:hypothetical protein